MSDFNLVLDIHWNNNPIDIEDKVENTDLLIEVPLGVLLNVGGGSDPQLRQEFETFKAETLAEQENVQQQIENIDNTNTSQSADIGYANLRINNAESNINFLNEIKADKTYVDQQDSILSDEINAVKAIANTNELKISTKANQVDLEAAAQQIETNRLAILTKADISALAQLALLVDTKADQAYVNQQIATLVGSAPEALNTIYELAAAIQNEAGLIDSLNQAVANRVRFDIATQALTEIQKQNARTNIDAEKIGTAQQLISQITAQSIGAATTAQGAKADTALQSADVAPVVLTGSFTSLSNQNKIFDVVFTALQAGINTGILATDTLGQMLAKLQAQINTKTSLILGETAADAYRGDRGKTAYDHSQATGNVHGVTTGQINESGSNKWYTSARVLAEVLTGLSLSTGGVISATDSILVALGKLQYQISNFSGGSGGFTWVNADQISGLTMDSPVQHKSLKFAKKDGILWVCGSLYAQGATNTSTKFFNISNSAYMVEQHVTNFFGAASQVAVCNITAHPITIGSPPSNANALAMFYVLNTNLYLRTPYGFSADGGYIAFKPTPIGRLV